MESILITTVLDRGTKYLGNHPDQLSKRMALAHVLLDARAVRTVEAGVLAFRIWNTPGAREHTVQVILDLANEKAKHENSIYV